MEHTRDELHILPKVADATKAHLASTNDITSFAALKNLIYIKEAVEI